MKVPALTLVEMLIVMAIIGLLLGLGVAGMVRLQASMTAEQATNQLISILKAEKNKVKNNVMDTNFIFSSSPDKFSNVFGTRFQIEGGAITKTICYRVFDHEWDSPFVCSSNDENISSAGITNLSSVNCTDVIFENLTEKVYLFNGSDSVNTCDIGVETEAFNPTPYKYININQNGDISSSAP